MHEWQSLSHVRWECKYHIVIIPKYRKRMLAPLASFPSWQEDQSFLLSGKDFSYKIPFELGVSS